MPHEGIDFLPKKHLLSYEEMIRLVGLLAQLGITKVRVTGGEPFVRKDMPDFLRQLTAVEGINNVSITTNGVLTAPFVPMMKKIGISGINLSLDSLDRQRFLEMTRRDELPSVLKTFEAVLSEGIPLKINTVMMAGKNEEDVLGMLSLAEKYPVEVRFIEEMPFNGEGEKPEFFMSHKRIFEKISQKYPHIVRLTSEYGSTCDEYRIPGFKGKIGIISAFSRTFCGSCNRLRVTPIGELRTCLYAESSLNLRDMMRAGLSDEEIKENIIFAVKNKAKDGFEAESKRTTSVHESMTTIGG